ncbi:hypothetical protein EUX98_g5215 [Antrodiella citrinella]|uniref:Cytochrome P450 n=1 Tax=Antrodiella citrinella TaxID=2447956 RepID=A0A4S4MS32_9APHY|nr:hypothetical protein EUX98_g5215 [Antrodiella citrinella]
MPFLRLDMDCAIPMLPYGNRFRKCRKWVQDSFSNVALLTYRVKQRRETNVLLKGVLARPEALASHIARFTQALIMDIAYGHQVTTDDDKYIEMGEKGNHAFATAGSAGSMLVDFFPILKHYPTWLPGSAFKIRAINAAKLLRTMHDVPYNEIKYQLKHGNPQLSFTSTLLDSYFHDGKFGTLTEQDEKDIKGSARTLYSAGTETMASSMNTFVLAMLLYPNVYRKAQEEMDRVLGLSRLPELEDRESLPYLNAVIKETYRWLPPLPMTLPHMSSQDDVYNGYRIPKQTLVIGNAWGMARDENMYPDPESFCPERFLDLTNEDIADPRLYVFGFGRRLCPGNDFADSCIYMVLANIIATMNINKTR